MTVAEMLAELQNYPLSAEIVTYNHRHDTYTPVTVENYDAGENSVVITDAR